MRFVPRAMRFGTSRNQLGGDPRQIARRAPNVRGLRDDAIESSNRQMPNAKCFSISAVPAAAGLVTVVLWRRVALRVVALPLEMSLYLVLLLYPVVPEARALTAVRLVVAAAARVPVRFQDTGACFLSLLI